MKNFMRETRSMHRAMRTDSINSINTEEPMILRRLLTRSLILNDRLMTLVESTYKPEENKPEVL